MPKLVTRELTASFKLVRDDGTEHFYEKGLQSMPEADAEHYYVKAHTAKKPPPQMGDREFYDTLRRTAEAKRAEADDAEEQADAAEAAWREKEGSNVQDMPEDRFVGTPDPQSGTLVIPGREAHTTEDTDTKRAYEATMAQAAAPLMLTEPTADAQRATQSTNTATTALVETKEADAVDAEAQAIKDAEASEAARVAAEQRDTEAAEAERLAAERQKADEDAAARAKAEQEEADKTTSRTRPKPKTGK